MTKKMELPEKNPLRDGLNKTKGFMSKNAMLLVLLLVVLLFEVLISNQNKGSLFSPAIITNLIKQNAYVVILAAGMLLCILTGGNIDLSIGSMVALVGAFAGVFMVNMKWDPYLSVVLCLIIATALGAWQAFWIAYVRIPPFVTTLAGMMVFRSISLLMLKGQGISQFPEKYINIFYSNIPRKIEVLSPEKTHNVLGMQIKMPEITNALIITMAAAAVLCAVLITLQIFSYLRKKRKGYTVGRLPGMIVKLVVISFVILFVAFKLGQRDGIPISLIWVGAVVLFYSYFTQNTVPGRYLYAMGGNVKAARLSGVNTKKMMFFAYTNMGFLAGLTAMICVARFNQAGTSAGGSYEMEAIASCFIGGASAYGGVGTIGGAVIGAIFMGVLNMGFNVVGVDANLRGVIKGLVLLAAVIFDVLSKNRKQAA